MTRKKKPPLPKDVVDRMVLDGRLGPGLPALTFWLREIGWSDGALADRVGVSRSLISHVRLGRRPATPELRRDIPLVIAKEIGVDADQLRVAIWGREPEPRRTAVFDIEIEKGRS